MEYSNDQGFDQHYIQDRPNLNYPDPSLNSNNKRVAQEDNGPAAKRPCVGTAEQEKSEETNDKRDYSDDSEESESDSGSDNPRHLDYFFADSFLDEYFDPSEIYSLNDAEDESDDEEAAITRRRLLLEELLEMYKTQFSRLKDILQTKHCKFLKMQANQVQKHRKSSAQHRRNLPTTGHNEELQMRTYGNFHGLKHARSTLLSQNKLADENEPKIPPQEFQKELRSCLILGCPLQPLPATSYCLGHILNDPNQKLYEQCQYFSFASRTRCCNAIMTSSDPPFCQAHLDTIMPVQSNNVR